MHKTVHIILHDFFLYISQQSESVNCEVLSYTITAILPSYLNKYSFCRDDDIQSDEEIEQDHINTIMNLYNPEADW